MVIDYQRVKLFGKRFFFLKNSLDQNCAIQYFEKNLFILILMVLEVLAYLESSLETSLES